MTDRRALADTLLDLEILGPAGRFDYLKHAAVETGGMFHAPQACTWDSRTYIVTAYGVTSEARTADAMVDQWMRAARRLANSGPRLAEAEALVSDLPAEIAAEVLVDACRLVWRESKDTQLQNRAAELFRLTTGQSPEAALA